MEESQESSINGNAVGAFFACMVVGVGALRSVPIPELTIRTIVIGCVVSLCVRVMQHLLHKPTEEVDE